MNAHWQPSEQLRAQLLTSGWADRACAIQPSTIHELEMAGFQVHDQALRVLPRLAEQRLFIGGEFVDFSLKGALGAFDNQHIAATAKLAGCRFGIAGFSTWMFYIILEDDRWLVLHGDWGNCFTLPSTEAMLLWQIDPKLPLAINEVFALERLRELGVP
jgi:hypothetical protein